MKRVLRALVKRSRYLLADYQWVQARRAENNQPAKLYYDQHYDQWPVNQNVALYDMRDGEELDDSPFMMLRYWLKEAPQMQHVIVVKEAERNKVTSVLHFWQLDQDQRIHLVPYLSTDHMRALLTAGYVISNAMIFSDIFVKRAQQRFINTWHGTPLKKMGYAMPGGVMASWNVLRMLMMTDDLVLPNRYTADIFARDYRLSGLYPGRMVVNGYPRNDILAKPLPAPQAKTLAELLKVGSTQRVILYAPTWSGDGTTIDGQAQELDTYYQALTALAKIPMTRVFFRPHPYFKAAVKADQRFQPYRLPEQLGTNDILTRTDLLVTDYSSIFFDFLVTKRPIIFFDSKENYQQMRGQYLSLTTLPGPYTRDIDTLKQLATNPVAWQAKYQQQYSDFYARFVKLDDGQATQRIVKAIQEPLPPAQHAQPSVLVNGEDLTAKSFTRVDTQLVTNLAQDYDVSVGAFEQHLLDSWYGKQFFKAVDAVQAVSRIFINRDIVGQALTVSAARLAGRRMVGGIRFDYVIIRQAAFSRHQQMLLTTARTVIMKEQGERAAWLVKLGFSKLRTQGGYEVWQVAADEKTLSATQHLLNKLEEVE